MHEIKIKQAQKFYEQLFKLEKKYGLTIQPDNNGDIWYLIDNDGTIYDFNVDHKGKIIKDQNKQIEIQVYEND